MSTTPPEQPPSGEPYSTPGSQAPFAYTAIGANVARLPIPGNAELAVYLLVWLVIALIWIIGDPVDSGDFAILTVALTFGYLISRGIAKAGRVLEQ